MFIKISGLFVLLLFYLSTLTGSVYAQDVSISDESTLNGIFDRGQIRACLDATFPPFEMVSRKGGLRNRVLTAGNERHGAQVASFVGFDIDIARNMAKELGVDFIPVNTQWTSIIPALIVGRCDMIISGMTITEERAERVDFTSPYFTAGQTILLNEKLKDKVRSYKDLNDSGYTIASSPNTTGEIAVRERMPDAMYVAFGDEEKAINALKTGEVDAFVYDLPFIAAYIGANGSEGVVFLDQPFTEEHFGIAIRKNDPDLLNWLNEFLGKLEASGTYQQMYDKWITGTDWYKQVR